MTQQTKTIAGIAAALLLIDIALLAALAHKVKNEPTEPLSSQVDTLYIRDTITRDKPILQVRTAIDTLLVPVTDTLTLRDTIWMQQPREQIAWQDSFAMVYASGIRPQVDSVKHFVTTQVITERIPVEVVRKTRWGIGINAGYGASKDGLTPYVGIGITYNIISL